MASIQKQRKKDGGVSYRAQLHINGIRDSASFDSKIDARAWALEREAQILRGECVPPSTSTPPTPSLILRDVFQRYSREVSPTKVGVRWEQIRLGAFSRHPIADIPLTTLGPEHIAEWRDQRLKQVSSSTVRRELVLINHALQIAKVEWRLIDANPARDIRKPSDAPHRKQRITDDDLHKLVSALGYVQGTLPRTHNHQIAIALLFAIETACRSGEILGLTKDNVHLKEQYIHLPMTKNGHSRDVPLSNKAIELLSLMLNRDARSGNRVFTVTSQVKDTLFRRAKIKAGLENINFHDSRREATSRLSEIFGPMELSRITGHRDLKILMRYFEKPVSELAMKMNQQTPNQETEK